MGVNLRDKMLERNDVTIRLWNKVKDCDDKKSRFVK